MDRIVVDYRIVTSLTQIHHGIYKTVVARPPMSRADSEYEEVVDELPSGPAVDRSTYTFAFKTECRPAAKWHGQQGWPEAVVHLLSRLLFASPDDAALSSTDLFPLPATLFPVQGMQRHPNSKEDAEGEAGTNAAATGSDWVRRRRPAGRHTVPFAKGAVLILPEALMAVLHKDHCGVVGEVRPMSQLIELARKRQRHHHSHSNHAAAAVPILDDEGGIAGDVATNDRGEGNGVLLIGEAMLWRPGHRDDALPKPSFLTHWTAAGGRRRKEGEEERRSHVLPPDDVFQISDIFALDYLAMNEDRAEKNWFLDHVPASSSSPSPVAAASASWGAVPRQSDGEAANYFVAMDNGFAFAGRNYRGSVCGADEDNLVCPPLMRFLAASAGGANTAAVNHGAPPRRKATTMPCESPTAPAVARRPHPLRRKGDDGARDDESPERWAASADVALRNCRFRRATVARVILTSHVWNDDLLGRGAARWATWASSVLAKNASIPQPPSFESSDTAGTPDNTRLVVAVPGSVRWLFEGQLRHDGLLAFLATHFNESVVVDHERSSATSATAEQQLSASVMRRERLGNRNVALWRFIADGTHAGRCPAALLGEEKKVPSGADAVGLLGYGIGVRLRRLEQHLRDCIALLGTDYVFGE